MSSWHSYPKVYVLGHAALAELLSGPVVVEEKIDGSQFSFGMIDGILRMRSKGVEFEHGHHEKMFGKAVETAERIKHLLIDGWTYRCEYLRTEHHNTLKYSRVPKGNLVLIDINFGNESYLQPTSKSLAATSLGLECVPEMQVDVRSLEGLKFALETESFLGGPKVEGLVIKNYAKFGPDKKVLMGKFVSEAFKEQHAIEWKTKNPTKSDVIERLCDAYRSEARWAKSLQRLRDDGLLQWSPRDIPDVIKAVHADIEEECADEIKQAMFKYVWGKISRASIRGLPEWYKEQLAKRQFEVPT